MTQTQDVDRVIGARIKSRRIALKISQTALAEAVGVRFQQVQKYESGANRVSASRLFSIADTLGVPVAYFFLFGTGLMDLIDLAALDRTETGFTSFLNGLCDKLELDHATYCAVNTVTDQIIGFTTYSDEWKEHYGANKFQNSDPTLILPMRSIAPVDWSRLSGRDDFKQVFEHARDFKISEQGLSIPIHGPYGEVGLLSVARDTAPEDWGKLQRSIIMDLQTAAVSLHDTVMQSDSLGRALHRPTHCALLHATCKFIFTSRIKCESGFFLRKSAEFTVISHVNN